MSARPANPVGYKITFAINGYEHRKETVCVMAFDIIEAIEVARTVRRHGSGDPIATEEFRPRWCQSDASSVPDKLSRAAIEHYAALLDDPTD